MNKIIEFFNSELYFWINLNLALICISLWLLNWVLKRKQLKRINRENAEYFSKFVYAPMIDGKEICVGGKTDLLTTYLLEKIEEEKQKPKPILPEELCKTFENKYKSIELRSCPLCNSKSRLKISLHKYTQMEGFAGGYYINAKIHCSKCKCGLDKVSLYTNIRFSDESDNIERVDEIVSSYVKEWNERYDDLDKSYLACRHRVFGEGIERKNNIVCEEDNKLIAQIDAEKKEIEDQNLYFDNIAFPYDELVEMRRLGRHHCTVPPYFVSFQRPDSYEEDKLDET